MSNQKNGIAWTQETWNPIRGCSRVSDGCKHCYAETIARRFSGPGMPYAGLINNRGAWNGKVDFIPKVLDQPLRWREPRRIFVNSMSDLFHENLPDQSIDQVFQIMALAQHHTFQVLTKRPERMLDYVTNRLPIAIDWLTPWIRNGGIATKAFHQACREWRGTGNLPAAPLSNVWLGVSVEDERTANFRIPLLLQTPAAVRWISAEPLLGPIDLRMTTLEFGGVEPTSYDWLDRLGWVVVGGESGVGARPMDPEWAFQLRIQCADVGVPFFMKQLSGQKGRPVKDIEQFPPELRVREYPA